MSLTNISFKSLHMLENGLDNYKKQVLEDIYEQFLKDKNIDKQKFLDEFLEREKPKRVKLIKKEKIKIEEEDLCNAKVWHHQNQKYEQCKFKKLDGNNYCKKHVEKRNYGDIN